MEAAISIETLDFIVVNTKTGNAVAAFMLPTDAQKFCAAKAAAGHAHYEVRNLDGSPMVAL